MPEPASQATSVRAKSHPHKDQFLPDLLSGDPHSR